MARRVKRCGADGYIVDTGFDAVDFTRKIDAVGLARRICAGKEDMAEPTKVNVFCSGSGGRDVVFSCKPRSTRGLRGLRGCDTVTVRELRLFGENDATLYRQRFIPIAKNLRNKMARGTYDAKKAEKAWKHWADEAARRYTREHDVGGGYGAFDAETRRCLAREMARDFEETKREYDHLLYKKYKGSTRGLEGARSKGGRCRYGKVKSGRRRGLCRMRPKRPKRRK